MLPRLVLVITIASALQACAGSDVGRRTPVVVTATPSASLPPPATMAVTPPPGGTPESTPTPVTPASGELAEPVGFPLDPSGATDTVVGMPGSRTLAVGQGASVRETSERLQVSPDPIEANMDGWNCRVHAEYEAQPAVDWYVQPGRAVRATMDGTAMLIVNTVENAFDYYGVAREPYIGNPDRPRAPLSPFPGPGGGMGVEVAVVNDRFRTDYGHLDIARTVMAVPRDAFAAGFSRTYDYTGHFATPRALSVGDIVATWPVRRGDVIGYSGDAGYSEAPHLHYAITRRSDGARLCPTAESGFEDAGWLFR
jgi:hypothetical protein